MTPMTTTSPDALVDLFADFSREYADRLPRDRRDIKRAMRLEQDDLGVNVVAVAVHRDDDANEPLEIPTDDGTPLNYEAHDIVRDSYHVNAADYHEVGRVPVNYRLTIEGTPWEQPIPLPYAVLRRYLTDAQRDALDGWRAGYEPAEYEIIYLQTLGVF